MIVIVMGVSGSGKTTIGKALAEKKNIPFYDADDFHPPDNISKMASGTPLTDEDREPWLKLLSAKLVEWGDAVLACSALKEAYRERLTELTDQVYWVYLKGSKEAILKRMEERKGHYMKAPMLDSQFDTLEEPTYGLHISIEKKPDEIIADLCEKLDLVNSIQQKRINGH